MKKTIQLKDSELHRLISESVKRVLNESELGDRVQQLRSQSRTYKGDEVGSELRLDKTWNRGMGRQNFIEVLPDEGVILYNTMLTSKRDLERIKEVFPEFTLEPIDKPWHDLYNLRFHRK